ncbi:methyltransferase domain-containing protein [Candidatus Nitrosopelagicus sp.]|nr:methyltransferase domain-containing protein [Candidatus Nitrosopelagicus sp.]
MEILIETSEICEGFLICSRCREKYPIIDNVPIIMSSFVNYIQIRPSLGGKLLLLSKSKSMKKFIKLVLSKIRKSNNDLSTIEERWTEIYQKNSNSKYYSQIIQKFSKLPNSKFVLEHGSSIGIVSKSLGDKHENVFGIDLSYHAIHTAKKKFQNNVDFFVSDSLLHPFGKKKFDIVFALNMLELVEPISLLNTLFKQVRKGYIVISDPYDYERGKNSVKKPLYENDIRRNIRNLGMSIVHNTIKPSLLPWNLKINSRTSLNYNVDLIIAKKS